MYKNVENFLDSCDESEIQRIIAYLLDYGYISKSGILKGSGQSAGEEYFETSLDKIHGKWNQLSRSEEDFIISISKRFV